MLGADPRPRPTIEAAVGLIDLIETALRAKDLERFAEGVLPVVADTLNVSSVVLLVAGRGTTSRRFFQHGASPEVASEMHAVCTDELNRLLLDVHSLPAWRTPPGVRKTDTPVMFYPLQTPDKTVGLIGIAADRGPSSTVAEIVPRLFRLLAIIIDDLAERSECQRQLSHLNTYLSVSSMLSQSLDLHELLETTLYCCMEAVSAEAASVLLLDDEKKHFRFYQVEGPAKPVLMGSTFPADKGLAGAVLRSQQAEIIDDVHSDRRFYKTIDSQSGFQTRNMLVIPLTAGQERIGVLEVLNKAGGGPFHEEERLLLVSIAEEIAFAIRNARVFEYVVNTYCKQRQGQVSCEGCKRPLRSWTPCVKYRKAPA